MLIGESLRQAEQGASDTLRVAGKLSEIVAGIGGVTDLVSRIADSAHQQSSQVVQVSRAVEQMERVVQQDVAHSSEASASAEALTAQAQELEALARSFQMGTERRASARDAGRRGRPGQGVPLPATGGYPARPCPNPSTSTRTSPATRPTTSPSCRPARRPRAGWAERAPLVPGARAGHAVRARRRAARSRLRRGDAAHLPVVHLRLPRRLHQRRLRLHAQRESHPRRPGGGHRAPRGRRGRHLHQHRHERRHRGAQPAPRTAATSSAPSTATAAPSARSSTPGRPTASR